MHQALNALLPYHAGQDAAPGQVFDMRQAAAAVKNSMLMLHRQMAGYESNLITWPTSLKRPAATQNKLDHAP